MSQVAIIIDSSEKVKITIRGIKGEEHGNRDVRGPGSYETNICLIGGGCLASRDVQGEGRSCDEDDSW